MNRYRLRSVTPRRRDASFVLIHWIRSRHHWPILASGNTSSWRSSFVLIGPPRHRTGAGPAGQDRPGDERRGLGPQHVRPEPDGAVGERQFVGRPPALGSDGDRASPRPAAGPRPVGPGPPRRRPRRRRSVRSVTSGSHERRDWPTASRGHPAQPVERPDGPVAVPADDRPRPRRAARSGRRRARSASGRPTPDGRPWPGRTPPSSPGTVPARR